MTKLILTDFDGTLITKGDNVLKSEFIQKIINITNKGVLFAVNSGRPYYDLKNFLKPIIGRTVCICNDGAQIMYKNCLIYKECINKKAAEKIIDFSVSNKISTFISLRESSFEVKEKSHIKQGLFYEDIFKIILVKSKNTVEQVQNAKNLALGSSLRVCYEDEKYLELCSDGANKGKATSFLSDKFGIADGIVAFGDTEADFSMFEKSNKVYIPKGAKAGCFPEAVMVESVQDFIVKEF